MKFIYMRLFFILFVLTGMLFSGLTFPQTTLAALKTRVVVVPFYKAQGRDMDLRERAVHYRRINGFIQNYLVAGNFDVIDPFAKDLSDIEYNQVMERTIADSAMSSVNLCKRYAADAAFVVWLDIQIEKTPDGFHKARAIIDGSCYDSTGRSLGINVYKSFKVTRRNYDQAIGDVEKELGHLVGRQLAKGDFPTKDSTSADAPSGQSLADRMNAARNTINIRLDGATDYEVLEAFGKILNSSRGVTQVKLYMSNIMPDNPQACRSEWALEIADTEPFRLQANIVKIVEDILAAGGNTVINGVPFRYAGDELRMLRGIRTGSVSAGEIQFVIDRDRARKRAM